MRYQVTKEDAERFEGVVNEDDNSNIGECITRALVDFVNRIPEPVSTSPPYAIRLGNRIIVLSHVVAVEFHENTAYIYTREMLMEDEELYEITSHHEVEALRAFFFDAGRFPHVDLTPKTMTAEECFDKYGAEWTDEDAPTPDEIEEDKEQSISMSDRKAEAAERTAQGPMLMGDGLD